MYDTIELVHLSPLLSPRPLMKTRARDSLIFLSLSLLFFPPLFLSFFSSTTK